MGNILGVYLGEFWKRRWVIYYVLDPIYGSQYYSQEHPTWETDANLENYCKIFTIKNSIYNVAEAWSDTSIELCKGFWYGVAWKKCIQQIQDWDHTMYKKTSLTIILVTVSK